MPPAATQAARTAAAPATTRRAPARRAPARRPASARQQTARARRPRTSRPYAGTPMPARLVPIAVGHTASAVSGLAESGLVHRLTRGRMWIGLLTSLLVGIVALNVLTLSFNSSSSKATHQTDVLNRQISTLRAQVAASGVSNEHVQAQANALGMVVPEPGSIGYLNASPDDAATAAKRLESGELTAGSVVPADPSLITTTTTATPTTTTDPALTAVSGTVPTP
jgi:hypothetical protein